MIKSGGKGVMRRGGDGKGEVWIWGQDGDFWKLERKAEWAAEPGVEASKNRGEVLRTYAAMRAVAPRAAEGLWAV